MLELPLLAVDHQHRPIESLKAEQLKVKTGAGVPFPVVSMRKEGDDPLSLAILVDASRDSFHNLSQLGDDLAPLVGNLLTPVDRVSLYAVDCTMTRSMSNAVPDANALRKAVKDAVEFPSLHGGKSSSACGKTVHLWDSAAAAIAALTKTPGRRVLLLVSSGVDGASKYDWLAIQQYAFDNGVAIFALRDQNQADADDFSRGNMSASKSGGGGTIDPVAAPRKANNIELLCANAGGLTLTSTITFRKDALADIIFLMKSRYILTVPRDAYQPGTSHSAKVIGPPLTPFFFSATGALEPLEAR